MHYFIYGKNKVELEIFKERRSKYNSDEIITIESKSDLKDLDSIVKYKPFFNDRWFVIVELDKLGSSELLSVLKHLNNTKVELYIRIDKNRDAYLSINKSKVLNERNDVFIVNAKFPNYEFVSKILVSKVNKVFDSYVMNYIYNQLKFNISKLDEVIELMNMHDFKEISLTDIKKMLPPSKTRDIKTIVYCLLLRRKGYLKELWKEKDMKVVTSNAGTKVKSYDVLESIELNPNFILDKIIQTLMNIGKVKNLYNSGHLTETNVFNKEKTLDKQFEFLKKFSVPETLEYLRIGREVTQNEITYCLYEFGLLKANPNLTVDNLFLSIFKILNNNDES